VMIIFFWFIKWIIWWRV